MPRRHSQIVHTLRSSRRTGATRFAALAGVAALTAGLVSCSGGDYPMEAAPYANDPACADVIVRLPDTVAGQERRYTNAQSTGAWGNPANILLYCGTELSTPTTDDCVSVNGVDWVIDRSNAPLYRFDAYGRNPGVHVIVNGDNVSGTDTVLALRQVIEMLPQERECVSLVDEWEL